jgi:hypothetical protein
MGEKQRGETPAFETDLSKEIQEFNAEELHLDRI